MDGVGSVGGDDRCGSSSTESLSGDGCCNGFSTELLGDVSCGGDGGICITTESGECLKYSAKVVSGEVVRIFPPSFGMKQ
ncbi:hypothetical protein TSUD_135120 [Trifolium subterraneum]|uniref:Uncharacterized protein n=1 Tax=Trifolium subterraneum TaxID=3900 RepID=A0A2Z6P2W0_TRISU|nr:hypothetical protein TSUD_135120 [Trifolium subterraneum]